jgi:hypothetical protein
VAVAGIVYLPVLRVGPVSEDFQVGLKAARIAEDPSELLRPFQHVWRPASWGVFVPLVDAARADWRVARAVQLALGLAVLAAGVAVLRRVVGLSAPAALAVGALWVVSPLASESLLGETALAGHSLFALAFLGTLLAWRARRRVLAAFAAVVAAAANEHWVALPPLLLAADLWLDRIPARRVVRSLVPWAVGGAAWLVGYGTVTGFAYRSVYRLDAAGVAAKLAGTAGACFRLVPPSALVPGGLPPELRVAAAAGVALLAALTGWALWRRHAAALLCLVSCFLLLAPTAISLGQASRWTALPYLFFLGACAFPAIELWRHPRLGRALRVPLAGLVLALAAADVATVRADVADWSAFQSLGERVRAEAGPLLAAARTGRTLVVLRGDDRAPLAEVVVGVRGQPKLFFPRPHDPYGAVSLQALLTWELEPEGLALERVVRPPQGRPAAAFVHEAGRFRPLPAVPEVPILHPAFPDLGVPGVVLVPVPWPSFAPEEFP